MLSIFTKSETEIREEERLRTFAAACVSGNAKEVCTTYIQKADGAKVDTVDLTEKDLIEIIKKDLRTEDQGISAFDLIKMLKTNFEISPNGAVKLLELQEVYGHIISDIMGSAGYNKYLDSAHEIGYYIKQSKGNYSPLTRQEIKFVLMQMQKNIEGRKK